jgi:hypothetical protein
MTLVTIHPVTPINYEQIVKSIIGEASDKASRLAPDNIITVVHEYENPAWWHQMIAMMLTIATFQHNNLRYLSSCISTHTHTFQVT